MSHEDIDKHVRTYMIVFGSLLFLTVVTVAISYIHLPVGPAIALGLAVATVKGSLVACYFMHLIDERKLIYWVMGLSVVFFFFCLIIPVTTESLNIHTDEVAIFDKVIEPSWAPYGEDHGDGAHGGDTSHGDAAAEDHGDAAADDHGDAEATDTEATDAEATDAEATDAEAESADDGETPAEASEEAPAETSDEEATEG